MFQIVQQTRMDEVDRGVSDESYIGVDPDPSQLIEDTVVLRYINSLKFASFISSKYDLYTWE